MIARRLALLLMTLGTASAAMLASPALAKADWANTIAATPEGGILIGNPAAPIKLVEFASYTCGHCKAFHEKGVPALKAKYIANGTVSLEQRSFVRNGPDFSASLLVACQAPRPALAFVDKLFAEQDKWSQPFADMSAADTQAINAVPAAQQPAKMAQLGKLDQWADTRGVPLAKGAACLADKAAQDRLIASRNEAMTRYKLEGTPLFVINGTTVAGTYDWAALEPRLQAALKAQGK
jgi:protein-disulfide isomerase